MGRKIKKTLGLTILAIPGVVTTITLVVLALGLFLTQGLLWCLGLKEATLGSKSVYTLIK